MSIEVISLIGIIVAIVFMVWSIYRGLGMALASVIGTCIIILTSGMNFSEAFNQAMDSGVTSMLGTFAMVFLFGGILGLFYAESGAAASLGEAILSVSHRFKSANARRIVALALFLVFRILLTVAGIDGMACIIPTVALCVSLFQEMDIPRRYMNAFLITGCTVSLFMPWVPCGPNIMVPMFVEGYTAGTAWLPRIICVILMSVSVVLVLNRMIAKEQEKGEEHFELGKLDKFQMPPDMKKPHWALTLIPIAIVAVFYNVVGLDAWIALAFGTVAAIIVFAPYMQSIPGKSKFGSIIEKCNQGSMMISLMMAISFLPGCAIGITPAYNLIVQGCNSLSALLPGIVVFAALSVLLTLVGGSNTIVLCGLINSVFLPAGLSMTSMSAVMFVGTAVLSALPNSMYVCSQAEMTDCSMRESYGPVFKTNVILPALITALATVLVAVGIW
jgi:H+/gluconate symporter-like permease